MKGNNLINSNKRKHNRTTANTKAPPKTYVSANATLGAEKPYERIRTGNDHVDEYNHFKHELNKYQADLDLHAEPLKNTEEKMSDFFEKMTRILVHKDYSIKITQGDMYFNYQQPLLDLKQIEGTSSSTDVKNRSLLRWKLCQHFRDEVEKFVTQRMKRLDE